MRDIRFTGGKTPPETFPYKEFSEVCKEVLEELKGSLAYYPSQVEYTDYSVKGFRKLRIMASERYKGREGIELPVDNIVITNGSMHALELIFRYFLRNDDIVITEELTYYGTIRLLRYFNTRIVGVELDERDGMIIDDLEDKLKAMDRVGVKPKFIYVLPNNQNPTGARMPESARRKLLDLALEYDIPIVEDDCYGDLDFIEQPLPKSILTLDESKSVIYVASFSKIIGPGIRMGYFYSPDKHLNGILEHRWDLGTSILMSAILARFLEKYMWDQIKRQTNAIRKKRDLLLKYLEEYLSDYATWTKPTGGLFIWVKLSKEVDMDRLYKESSSRRVYYDDGWKFHYRWKKIKALRLSYAHLTYQELEEGIKRLAESIKASIGR